MSNSPFPTRSRFTGRSWSVLLFAVGLIVCSSAQVAYRFMLPTDGWSILTTEDFEHTDWVYLENLVGASSGLQRDDVITAVNGQSVEGLATQHVPAPPGWAAGQTVALRIMRQDQPLLLTVPIVHWTFTAVWQHLLVKLESLIGLVGGVVLFAVALFTFYQRSSIPAASALLVMSAAWLAINLSWLLPDGLSVQFNQLAAYTTAFFGYLLFVVLLAPSLLAFTLLFPQPKRIIRHHPSLVFVPFAVGIFIGILAVTGQAPVLGWLATQVIVVGSLINLIHAGFTQRDAVSRTQLRWAGGGFAVGMACMLLVFPAASGSIANPLLTQAMGSGFHLGFTVIGVALAIAILRYRLFDIDLVINRALVYALLTSSVIGIYLLVVGYLGWLFRTEENLLLSLIATGIVAVAFAPLRNLVQRGVNRLMYGERDEPYRVLTRLGRQLETALEPASALALTVETIAQALKLPYVAIALRQSGELQTRAAYGAAQNHVSRYPLTYAGESVGELAVASRAPNESLNGADQRLLQDLARQIGVVTQAASLSTRLEQARLRLVTERGEARRQLGGDLHDGVGHQLVGLTRQVERAMRTVKDDPALAHTLLEDTNRQLVALTQHVRVLAHQLFPPELALLGLVGALRERAQTHPTLRMEVDAPEHLPPLPAETETAVYYIALEALTNVEKHAKTRDCTVRLNMIHDQTQPDALILELAVCDDGIGLSAHAPRGLGLLSMQARAAEVGGTCNVEASEGRGTSVIARIPCTITLE